MEWVTQSENSKHVYEVLGRTNGRGVEQLNGRGKVINTFRSVSEAARSLIGGDHRRISEACKEK